MYVLTVESGTQSRNVSEIVSRGNSDGCTLQSPRGILSTGCSVYTESDAVEFCKRVPSNKVVWLLVI
jgi:hypothetical protein